MIKFFKGFLLRLFSLLLSIGLLVGYLSQPAIAVSVQSNQPNRSEQLQSDKVLDAEDSSAYSSAQLSKLSKATADVSNLRSRLEAFKPAIEKHSWSEVHKDVSSLLPDLKQKMMSVTDQLTLNDRILARAISTEVFIHLERIDEADEVYDYQAAETNYFQALQDFNEFLKLIPTS